MAVSGPGSTWKQSEYKAHSKIWDNASFIPTQWIGNEPWISFHADREISTALVGSLSKYIPMSGCTNESRSEEVVEGIIKIEAILKNMSNTGGGIHVLDGPTGDKSQSGMPPEIVARFEKTSLNPVLLQSPSFWLIMLNIPVSVISLFRPIPMIRACRCHRLPTHFRLNLHGV